MKFNLNDLNPRNLPRDPGSWPMPPKIALLIIIFAALLVGAYFLDWRKQNELLVGGENKEKKLRDEWKVQKAKALNKEKYADQLVEINQKLGQLLKQLPNRSEIPSLLEDINKAGLSYGLEFLLFKPSTGETMKEFYAELPIMVKVSGAYHDVAGFASAVAGMPRIVTLNDVNLVQDPKTNVLTLETTAKTFRYLDEEEVSEQKKAAAEKKKGAKEKK
jgi:type IV pilus assembly protein PilO